MANRYVVRVGDRWLDEARQPTVTEYHHAAVFSNLQANLAANEWVGAAVESKMYSRRFFPRGGRRRMR